MLRERYDDCCHACKPGKSPSESGLGNDNDEEEAEDSGGAPEFWIQCDACARWFHLRCVKLQEYETVTILEYHCSRCRLACGPSIQKELLLTHRYNFHDNRERNLPIQVGTPAFIDAFKERESRITSPTEEHVAVLNDGIGIGSEFDRQEEWTKILIVRSKKGLGLGVPDDNFGIKDCVEMIGRRKLLGIIDVYKQHTYQMTLGRFYELLMEKDRPRIYNILSLEFSDSRLMDIVTPPSIVKELSWVDRFWAIENFLEKVHSPLSLEEHVKAKPEVSHYCLIGMAGSFTDFHIDFGGSSVWYHVFQGQKIFYVVPPTPENLSLYFDYHQEAKKSEVFFADRVGPESLFRVVVNRGETLFIPSGWIHAVYTPVDTLVFGGNFLHARNIAMQLWIYKMEVQTGTESSLMFPAFELVNWYAAAELIEQLKEINQDDSPHIPSDRHLFQMAKVMTRYLMEWLSREGNVWKRLFGHIVPALQKELENHEKKRQKEAGTKRKVVPNKRLKRNTDVPSDRLLDEKSNE